MNEVLERVRAAHHRIDAKDEVRDRMLEAKREVTSKAREAVNLAHQDRFGDALDAYEQSLKQVGLIREDLKETIELWHSGAMRNSLQELAEAWAVLSLFGAKPTLPEEMVTPEALVLGVGDAIGELRRRALDALIAEDPAAAEARLEEMEALYEELRTIDVPSGLVDVKRKVDVARTLVDKTRGKIALGRIEQRLTRLDRGEDPQGGKDKHKGPAEQAGQREAGDLQPAGAQRGQSGGQPTTEES